MNHVDCCLVDSFLVREGRAIRPDLHRKRFGDGYPVLGEIPQEGQWFPRITENAVEWRLAPALRTHSTLWVPETVDPREHPLLKGPDLPKLAELRQQARDHGADDAVLYSARGVVNEAANAAIVFKDEKGLVMGPHGSVLLSTTVRATVEAGLIDQPRRVELSVEEASQLPAWCASALHGWTPVTKWLIGGETLAGAEHPALGKQSQSAAELNEQLWQSAVPLAEDYS